MTNRLASMMWWMAFAVAVAACGSDDRSVAELDPTEQTQVCRDFVSAICALDGFDDFCTACATGGACSTAAVSGAITRECQPAAATVSMVEDCAEAADETVCGEGGGCMFDAIEAIDCP